MSTAPDRWKTWMLAQREAALNPDGWRLRVRRRLRYDDIGDWDDQKRELRVLDVRQLPGARLKGMDPALVHAAVLTHEWIEMLLCKQQGLHGWRVDRLEAARRGRGIRRLNIAHRFALRIERSLIEKFGYDWKTYCGVLDAVDRLAKRMHRDHKMKGRPQRRRRRWQDMRVG